MSQKPVELLLVEDEDADIATIKNSLAENKIMNRMQVAKSGPQALEILRKEGEYSDAVTPDIILLDLNMPGMDGKEVLQEIKKDQRIKRIPVVIMTSSDAEEDILKSYDLGCNCYIRKPVDFDELKKIVKNLEEFWFTIVTRAPK